MAEFANRSRAVHPDVVGGGTRRAATSSAAFSGATALSTPRFRPLNAGGVVAARQPLEFGHFGPVAERRRDDSRGFEPTDGCRHGIASRQRRLNSALLSENHKIQCDHGALRRRDATRLHFYAISLGSSPRLRSSSRSATDEKCPNSSRRLENRRYENAWVHGRNTH